MKKIGLLSIATLFLLSGCMTTNLSEVDIAEIVPIFTGEDSEILESLIPGHTYRIQFRVFDKDGNQVNRPNHTDFIVSSPNDTLIVKRQKTLSIVLESSDDVFQLIKDQEFLLNIEVVGSQFNEKEFQWAVDWSEPTLLNYKGEDGDNGLSGHGSLYSESGGKNINGKPGKNGENGSDGSDSVLYAFYYDIGDLEVEGLGPDKMVLIVDGSDGSAYLAPPGDIIIDARGGNGGCGGDGGDAKVIESSENSAPQQPQDPEKKEGTPPSEKADSPEIRGFGGPGGRGGDGGDGGNMTLYYQNPIILDHIAVKIEGGQGGDGGRSGTGTAPSDHPRRNGGSGRNGSDGGFIALPLNPDKMETILSLIGNPLFERSRVVTD